MKRPHLIRDALALIVLAMLAYGCHIDGVPENALQKGQGDPAPSFLEF